MNWIAYERIRRRRGFPALQAAATALGYVRAVKRIVGTFAPRGARAATEPQPRMQGVGFGAEGAFSIFEDVTWRSFLASCVRGHEHYMSAMPPELIKPSLLPNAARFLLAVVPSLRRKTPPKASQAAA